MLIAVTRGCDAAIQLRTASTLTESPLRLSAIASDIRSRYSAPSSVRTSCSGSAITGVSAGT
ncbi:MAG: hypothetical protein EBV77_10410 [Gemmatimonadaceae bacterium]|nr:hypothetical protein [Gemmatimonadaceae bacterium]